MAEIKINKEREVTDNDGNLLHEKPTPQYITVGYSPTDTNVRQTSNVTNTINNIDNSNGFMGGLGKDGASTLVMGIIGLGFAAVMVVGIAAGIKRRKKKK